MGDPEGAHQILCEVIKEREKEVAEREGGENGKGKIRYVTSLMSENMMD